MKMEDSNTMSPPPKTKINFEEDGKDEDDSNVICTVKPVPEKFICFVCKEILLQTLDGLIRHILINHTEVSVNHLVQFPESQQDDTDDSIVKSQTLPITGSGKVDSYYLSILLISSENIANGNDSIRGTGEAAFQTYCSTFNPQKQERQHSIISNDPGTSKMTAKQSIPARNNEEENVDEGNKAEDDLGEGDLDKDGDEPYPCPILCGSAFYSKDLLSLHVLSHHGHRNTITELVIKNTSQTPTTPTTLKAHSFSMVIMSSTSQNDPVESEEGDYNGEVTDDVEPYICYGCLMPFYSTDRLLEHIRRLHVGHDFKFLKFLLQRTFEEYRSNNFKTDRQPPTTRTTSELEPIAISRNSKEVEVLSDALESVSFTSDAEQEEPHQSTPAEHEEEGSCAPLEVSDSSSVSSTSSTPTSTSNEREEKLTKKNRAPISIPDHIKIIIHGETTEYECSLCQSQKPFKTRANIKYHLYCGKGDDEKPFGCEDCGQRFISKGHYEYHKRTHSGEKPYPCTVCGKSYSQKGKVKRHMKIHTGEKPFICQECNKGFATPQSLRVHTYSHIKESIHACSICNKRFTAIVYLNRHLRIHQGFRNFLCAQCGSQFLDKWSLDVHMKRHSDLHPYHCEKCGKTFVVKKDLDRHVFNHTGVKPFSCKMCNKAMRRLDNLRRHLKNVHEMPVKVVNKHASEAHAEYNKNKLASSQMKLQKISPNSSSTVMSNSTNSQPSTSSSTSVNRSDNIVKPSTRKSRGTKRKPVIISKPRSLGSRNSARLFEKQQRTRNIGTKAELDGETRIAIGTESFPACGESRESSRGPVGTTDGKQHVHQDHPNCLK